MTIPISRPALYAVMLALAIVGIYLLQLWQPDRQVELHAAHFLRAVEQQDWSGISDFLDEAFQDQWGDDRATIVLRMRQICPQWGT